jgi:hypothetical protein
LDGQKIYICGAFKPDLKPGTEVDAAKIAQFRHEQRMAFFFYQRKKARWITLSEKVK